MATEKSRLQLIIEANTAKFKEGMADVQQGLAASGGSMAKMARVGKMNFAAVATAAATAAVVASLLPDLLAVDVRVVVLAIASVDRP